MCSVCPLLVKCLSLGRRMVLGTFIQIIGSNIWFCKVPLVVVQSQIWKCKATAARAKPSKFIREAVSSHYAVQDQALNAALS